MLQKGYNKFVSEDLSQFVLIHGPGIQTQNDINTERKKRFQKGVFNTKDKNASVYTVLTMLDKP